MRAKLYACVLIFAVLLVSEGLSQPPVLKQLPDLVIGDADEPGPPDGFWTADVNLFRFSDAFAFDDYIENDEQTTPSLLRWCFTEDPASPGALEINGMAAVNPMMEEPWNPPPAKNLRSAAETVSFRDIWASPHAYDAAVVAGVATYPGYPLCDELITFWVSEPVEWKADSDTIEVKSEDGAIDHLAGATLVTYYSFDTGQGWSAATFTGYSLPMPSGPDGQIGLTGPAGGFAFGFWQTADTAIPYEADKIFRARYFLSRGAGVAAGDVPQVRLRWRTATSASTADLTISSTGSNSNIPPEAPATKEYASYLYPVCDTGGLGLTFDMLDFDSTDAGLVSLDKIIVETIDRSLLGTATAVQSYDTNFNTWEFNVNFSGAFTAVTSTGSGTDMIALTSTVAGSEAGFAQTPANAMAYTAGKLYRATFDVSRTGAAANTQPWVRLRAFSEDNQISAAFNILHGTDDGGAAPQTTATGAFEVYWETPTLPGSPETGEDGFRCAFDLIDFSATEGDTMRLESLAVEYFAIPANTGP